MKRLLALLLALALIACCTACGSTSQTTTSSSASETVEEQAEATEAEETAVAEQAAAESTETETASESTNTLPIVEEPITYTMFMTEPFFITSMIENMSTDLLLLKTVQEYTNIYFDITAINGEVFEEQFRLMLVAGDYADVMDGMSYYTSGYDAAIADEICIDLYDLVKEYAPNYWADITEDVETLAQLVTDEGNMATFAVLYAEANSEKQGYLLRADWLEEQNLTVPATYDELHDVLLCFQEAYSSKGISFAGYSDSLLSFGYECAAGDFMVIDDAVVSGYTMDGYYEYIAMCVQWYAEGLIYTDYYTASEGDYTDLMVSNELSMLQSAATSFSTIYAYLQEGDTLSLTAMTPVKISAEDELHWSWNYPNLLKRTDAWSISATCENPIPLVQFVDYMYSDEGILLFNYGVEGETFEYDSDGNPQYTDLIINNDDLPYFFASYLYVSNAATEYLPTKMDVSASYYSFGDEEWNAYNLFREVATDSAYNYPDGAAMTQDEQTTYASLNSDIETYVEETVNSWIVGTREFSKAAFTEFVETLQSMGLDTMVALKQSAYDRYLAKLELLADDIN